MCGGCCCSRHLQKADLPGKGTFLPPSGCPAGSRDAYYPALSCLTAAKMVVASWPLASFISRSMPSRPWNSGVLIPGRSGPRQRNGHYLVVPRPNGQRQWHMLGVSGRRATGCHGGGGRSAQTHIWRVFILAMYWPICHAPGWGLGVFLCNGTAQVPQLMSF